MMTKKKLKARRKRLWRLVALLDGSGRRGGRPLAGKSRARYMRELGRLAIAVLPPSPEIGE